MLYRSGRDEKMNKMNNVPKIQSTNLNLHGIMQEDAWLEFEKTLFREARGGVFLCTIEPRGRKGVEFS